MSKKILLMHISNVSGHFQATYVIECAIKSLDSNAETLGINAFNYTSPIAEKIINTIYLWVIKKAPIVWKLLYDNPYVVLITNKFKKFIRQANLKKILVLYNQFEPDVVICTQAYPCGMVADLKRSYEFSLPLIAVVTDFMPHSFWVCEGIDYYIVASLEAENKLIQKGVPKNRIRKFGIPIKPEFKNCLNKDEIRKKLNLSASLPVVLIMGGGQGLGPIKQIISILDKSKLNFQCIVIAGTNRKLSSWLIKHKNTFNKKIICLDFVNNIDELMEISTVIITKPGGLTTAEALAKGLPMVIVKPIPGQEENNTQFLLNNNAAFKIDNLGGLNSLIESLLTDTERFNKIHQAAYGLSLPNASLDIAKLALSLCTDEHS